MGSPYIDRVVETFPDPTGTLVDGKPQNWAASSRTRTPWGRLAVLFNSVDFTYYRNQLTTVDEFGSLDPFGDGPAVIFMPQLTPWDDVRAMIPPGSPADIWYLNSSDTPVRKLWAGQVIGYEDRDPGVAIECNGAFFDLDRFVAKPDFATSDGLGTRDTGEHIVERVNDLIDTYGVNLQTMSPTSTGIVQRNPGAFEPVATGWCKDLLAKAQTAAVPGQAPLTSTVMWTIECENRQPVLTTRDWTTNVFTFIAGAPGVNVRLSEDYVGVPSAIYGHGTSEDNCSWHNTKWPNNRAWGPDATWQPPDWQAGWLPFTSLTPYGGSLAWQIDLIKKELINTGFGSGLSPIGGPFVDSDFIDGPIGWFKIASGLVFWGDAFGSWESFGQADWEALFQTHGTAGTGAPFYLPIYQDTRTKRYNYDSRGVNLGPNPNYDASKPRIEQYVDYGKSNKFAAAIEARRKIETYDTDSVLGTVDVEVDPQEGGSRFEIRAGDNIDLAHYRGSTRRLHIAKVVHRPEDGRTSLTVDEQVRDYLSIQAIYERDQKAKADPAARIRTEQAQSRIREDRMPPWDCEAGSGAIPRTAVEFGLFTVIKFPAARFGKISHIRLWTTGIDGSPYETVFVFAIWGRAVTHNQVVVAATDGTGSVNDIDWNGIQPYWPAASGGEPTALAYAAGSATRACGWWPNEPGDHNNPDDAAGTGTNPDVGPITGEYRDSGGWEFYSQDPPWLWLSILPLASCWVEGKLYFSDTQPDE